MKTKTFFLYVSLLCTIVAAGCVAHDLSSANSQLAGLYSNKREAQNDWQQQVAVKSAFSALATKAYEACQDTSVSQENRISFCRVAATAAWQAGESKALEYATAGDSLCDQNGNLDKVPRDCVMLKAIPSLAAIDDTTRKYNALKARNSPSGPPTVEDYVKLFNDLDGRAHSLLNTRKKAAATAVDQELINAFDGTIGKIVCKHMANIMGDISGFASTDPGEREVLEKHRNDAKCKIYKQKKGMKEGSISKQNAPCLPAEDLSKPEGCQ